MWHLLAVVLGLLQGDSELEFGHRHFLHTVSQGIIIKHCLNDVISYDELQLLLSKHGTYLFQCFFLIADLKLRLKLPF